MNSLSRYLLEKLSIWSKIREKNFSNLIQILTKNRLQWNFSAKYHYDVQGDIICPNQVMGISYLRNPRLNKGTSFTMKERQYLGIQGLLPPICKSQEEQLALCKTAITAYKNNLNKYLYLVELQDLNEKLFFRFLSENIQELMPIVYTPTVGLACQKFGLVYRRCRGLFITIYDKGNIFNVVKNWPETNVRAVCVTDGERILGLGDLGACGMGIPVGKLALYTALAGIKPHYCLPVTLDVGTNNTEFLNDPLYIGLKEKRISGKIYDELLDEFMAAIVRRYGQNTLIQFEDFSSKNAFRLLEKYRNKYCAFNDDIQGTGAVVLAGLIASTRITERKKMREHNYCFFGAGGAALGIANLIVSALKSEGLTEKEALDHIWMIDNKGLLTTSRDDIPLQVQSFIKNHPNRGTLLQVLNDIKPSVLIGVSTQGGAFTSDVLKVMGQNNKTPIIMALSNPNSNSECTAEEAYIHTNGKCIFASGSPFDAVEYNGKLYKTGQGNNAYIFPGVALGVITTGIHHIDDTIFLIAADELSKMVTDEELKTGSLYPTLARVRECSLRIAMRIFNYAYDKQLATLYPSPVDAEKYIREQMYDYTYNQVLPDTWSYPLTEDKITQENIKIAKNINVK